MSNQTDPRILNPDTYLNYLSPDQATQFEVSRDVYIAALGIVVGDILSFIPQDIKIIKRRNGFITVTCFALTRIFALIYMALSIVLFTGPVANCSAVKLTSEVFCILTMATTSFLFLRRVQAVYAGNRIVYWTFTSLCVGIIGVAVLLIPGTKSRPIPGTGHCTGYKTEKYVPTANFMPAIFDSLVFFAISYKIAFQHNRRPGNECSWTSSWFSAGTLSVLSKAVLQSGQQYYLITFVLNIFAGAFSFNPHIPPMYRTLIAIPAAAFSACLACRAHRIMVEAFYDYDEEVSKVSTIRFVGTEPHSTVSQNMIRSRATIEPA